MFRAGLFRSFTSTLTIDVIVLTIVAAIVFGIAVIAFRRIRVS
jgi:hypothetical protein